MATLIIIFIRNEVIIFKFTVKLNTSENVFDNDTYKPKNTDEFSYMIDRAVDKFFENHLIRFSALGKDVLVPHKGMSYFKFWKIYL